MITYVGKQMRNNKGLTIKQVSEMSGIAPSTISKWENGTHLPDLYSLDRIASVFKVKPWKLVIFEKDDVPNPKRNQKQRLKRRVNTTLIMNNGLKATIIAYRSAKDMDVRLENGTEFYHVQYSNFKRGKIGNRRDKIKCKD